MTVFETLQHRPCPVGVGPTLNDEVDFSGFWFLVGEDGADVGPFVVDVDILDFDAVLRDGYVFQQGDARIQRPLLIAREQNGGAIEPRHAGYFAVNVAPEKKSTKKKKNEAFWRFMETFTPTRLKYHLKIKKRVPCFNNEV